MCLRQLGKGKMAGKWQVVEPTAGTSPSAHKYTSVGSSLNSRWAAFKGRRMLPQNAGCSPGELGEVRHFRGAEVPQFRFKSKVICCHFVSPWTRRLCFLFPCSKGSWSVT